jgi:hypothetical protein
LRRLSSCPSRRSRYATRPSTPTSLRVRVPLGPLESLRKQRRVRRERWICLAPPRLSLAAGSLPG